MSIFEVGRLCVKLAGRDAGKKCVVVDLIDSNYVVVDGMTRRKKVNIKHLEPLDKILEIKSGASHNDVKKVFDSIGLTVFETKPKEAKERPKHMKKVKVKKEVKPKAAKKEEPKAEAKEEKKVEEKKEVKKEVKEEKKEEPKEEKKEVVPEAKPEEKPSEEIKEVI